MTSISKHILIVLAFAIASAVLLSGCDRSQKPAETNNGQPSTKPKPETKQQPESKTQPQTGPKQATIIPPAGTPIDKKVLYRNHVIVLMYHHLEEKPSAKSRITPQLLDDQIAAMIRNGFRIISMDEYLDFMLDDKPVPENAVLLTFDDGYASFYDLAFPVLRKYGVTATDFIMAGTIDNPRHPGIKKMTWDQMRELKASGMSFYNHTFDSHKYAEIDKEGHARPMLVAKMYLRKEGRMETTEEYDKRIKEDIRKAEECLRKELGNTRGVLAFPYGRYNNALLKAAKEAGIEVFLTIDQGINGKADRIGYRINAGNQSMTPDKLIKKMKEAIPVKTTPRSK
ncbi:MULTISPECIES: polysaccharide deacetylase family protein [Paenibacillus]|nr:MULTISPECIES: polysaccharide deacetylase family protein [Paenibacillus]